MDIIGEPSGYWSGSAGSVYFGAQPRLFPLISNNLSVRYLKQVHGNLIHGDASFNHCWQEGDGLITSKKSVALAIRTADCIPLHLWDSERIGMIHAGWRSVRQNIVLKLIQDFKTESAVAILGPSISAENYEVDRDLYDDWLRDWPALESFLSPALPHSSKRNLDLRGVVVYQLEQAGIPSAAIYQMPPCTFGSKLPSYRREGQFAKRIINYIYRR